LVLQQHINVHVKSHIPWKSDYPPVIQVKEDTTIRQFCEQIGIEWDVEALVFLNNQIAHESQILHNNDQVLLMIPVVGG